MPSLRSGTLTVIYAPHAAREASSLLIAQLTRRGAVVVLDGGNRFQPYRIAHLLRQGTTEMEAMVNRLFIRRAFTCYQMLALLQNTPSLPQPYVILDLLATFYDEHVASHEAGRLLEACLQQVERLRQMASLLITLAPPLTRERAFLAQQVWAQADQILTGEPSASRPYQPALF